VLALVILHAGTMCHLANTTVMTVSIISIERKCLLCVFMPLAIQWMGLEVFVFYCPSLHACMHAYVRTYENMYICVLMLGQWHSLFALFFLLLHDLHRFLAL